MTFQIALLKFYELHGLQICLTSHVFNGHLPNPYVFLISKIIYYLFCLCMNVLFLLIINFIHICFCSFSATLSSLCSLPHPANPFFPASPLLFLCLVLLFYDSLSLIRVFYMTVGWGLFHGTWVSYQLLQ